MMKKIYRPGVLAIFIVLYIAIEYIVYCLLFQNFSFYQGISVQETQDTICPDTLPTSTDDEIADEILLGFHGDGRTFDVRGKIKTLKFYNGEECIVNFDESGRFLSKKFDGHDEYEVTRDSDGKIIYNHSFNDCWDTFYTGNFSYDSNGCIQEYKATSTMRYCSTTYRYKYDTEDNIMSAKVEFSVFGEDRTAIIYITNPSTFESNIKYTILEKDDRNNWTKRQVTGYEYSVEYFYDEEEVDENWEEVGYTVHNDGSRHPVYAKKNVVNRKEARILEYYD